VASGKWGQSQWNADQWRRGPIPNPPHAGWGDDWRWWYQYARQTKPEWDLTTKVVEAQWSTEGHTMGDGTLRGDLQPGHLTLHLNDPTGLLVTLSMTGMIWGQYRPTGATWCYFIDTITAGLSPPGSPERWNVVITGNTWAQRLTTGQWMAGPFPQQSVNARLTGIAANMNADTGLYLPAVTSSIGADPHTIPATVPDPAGFWPAYLQQVRDAGALGLVWLDAVAPTDHAAPGVLWLTYTTWDSAPARALDEVQYNAGTAWSFGFGNVVTRMTWNATSYLAAASKLDVVSSGYGSWGVEGKTVRIWGDVTPGAPQEAPCRTITQTIFDAVGMPKPYVNQIMATSGDRMHPDGSHGAPWDPTAHVWRPHHVMQWNREGTAERYRVTQTAHRLTVWRWESMHTLEVYIPAAAMPT
jgi:hypothetical protein